MYESLSFEQIFKNSGNTAFIVMDKQGIIYDSNRGVEITYGYTKEDLAGKNFAMLFTQEDKMKKMPEVELTSVLQKGFFTDVNYIVHKDGSNIWTTGETIATKDNLGETLLVKIIYDTNKEKLLETFLMNANKELNVRNEQLKKVNTELDAFVYIASHDLKAPINNIEGLISILEEGLDNSSKAKSLKSIEMMRESVTRFKTIIAELEITGRLKSASPDTTAFYFSEILEDTKLALREEIDNARALFIEDLAEPTFSNFSRRNLRSILHNLISNSIKYRSPERKLQISVATHKENDHLVLKVTDNGMGIKEELKSKIFDMYERAHNHVEGTGVGLSIVKKLVTNNGGKIEVESREGEGTTFSIYFPHI